MKRSLTAAALLMLVFVGARAQTPAQKPANSFIGKWRLNLEKSAFTPGPKPATGFIQVMEVVARPDGWMVTTFATIDAQGVPSWQQSVARFDGKDYMAYNKGALSEFVAKGAKISPVTFRLVDPNTLEANSKDQAGKVTITRMRTVSRDGKTLTDNQKGSNAQGQPYNNVLVYDRVP